MVLLSTAYRFNTLYSMLTVPRSATAYKTTKSSAPRLLVEVQGSNGMGHECLIRYDAQKLPGFAPEAGSRIRLWLVTDGEGHAIISVPDCPGASDATITTPNSFELRTLGL